MTKVLQFDHSKLCCGCELCSSVCPLGAITMKADGEGFYVPVIVEGKCIVCRKCEQVCLVLHPGNTDRPSLRSGFLFSTEDIEDLSASASGGAFLTLAKDSMAKGGYACGCAWTDDLEARHFLASGLMKDDPTPFASSKYVQSVLGGSYAQAKQALRSGANVVFGGTPCQIEALGRYLEESYENLLSVSVVCRGAGSPKIWRAYKHELERSEHSKLVSVDQRSKARPGFSSCCYEFANGNIVVKTTYIDDYYTSCFASGLLLRESCYNCPAKSYSKSDIIIGDDVLSDNSKSCASLVLCLTEKGERWVESVLPKSGSTVCLTESELSALSSRSDMLFGSSDCPKTKRQKLFCDIDSGVAARKAMKRSLPLKHSIKVLLHRLGLFRFVRKLRGKPDA